MRISIGELERDLSGVINQAAYGKERIVIVSRGKPKAAMIGMEDLERLRKMSSYDREAQIAWLARADALRERTRRWQAAHGRRRRVLVRNLYGARLGGHPDGAARA